MKKLFLLSFFFIVFQGCPEPLPDIKLVGEPFLSYTESTGTVTIHWSTNVSGYSKVEFGLTDNLISDTLLSEERMEHSVPLLYLMSDTLYYYRVISKSEYFEGKAVSAIDTFRTGTVTRIYSIEDYTAFAWASLTNNELWKAHDYFVSALELDEYYISALTGKAWTFLLIGGYEDTAYDLFNMAVSRDNTAYDAYAGRVIIYYQREQYQKCIDDVTLILDYNPHYRSMLLTDIIYENYLRTFLAGAYYNKALYEFAQLQCDLVFPENGLVEGNSSTWTVNSTFYDTYHLALLALIQSLFSELGYF